MYNLSTILDEYDGKNIGVLSHGINSIDLKKSMEQIENEYLDSSKHNVSDFIVLYT